MQRVDDHPERLLEKLLTSEDQTTHSRIEHGLLINFGGQKLQVKKYILSRET
jgi:hypothetical protein